MPESETEWVTVEFRRKWRDNVLRLFMCVFGGLSLPPSLIRILLRWSLTAETYSAVTDLRVADIILSTGSSVAAVNLLLGRVLGAKRVTCRRPSPLGVRNFDLAILPMFSWYGKGVKDNVCQTVGVPNPIAPDTLNIRQKQLIQELNLPACPRIGLLIGGVDRHETITVADAEQLSEICETVITEMNAQILVTTSRRTPAEVTAHLASTLKPSEWCPFFIEPDVLSALTDPYQAVLALSDLLIVTADSFSMVCEAASSGRPVIVLTLSAEKGRRPKRYNVYQHMERHAVVTLCSLEGLRERIAGRLTSCIRNTPLRDTETAVQAIRCLIETDKR